MVIIRNQSFAIKNHNLDIYRLDMTFVKVLDHWLLSFDEDTSSSRHILYA